MWYSFGLYVLALGRPSSLTTMRGVFTSPDSMASFRPKSLTIQENKAASSFFLPLGAKGVAEKS